MTSAGDTSSSLHLPALKSLGDLAEVAPVLVIDNREQTLLVFTRLLAVRGTLYSGDYGIQGLEDSFAVERKSIEDLVSCCMGENRNRFSHELQRLRGFRFKRLVIIGSRGLIETQRYRSRISPAAVLGSLAAWEICFDLPVVFCETPEAAALQIERWALTFARQVVRDANNLLRGCRAFQETITETKQQTN